jgi:hypothetical protein
MARNHRRFRVVVGDLVLDSAHEQLYARYRAMAGDRRAESLDEVLGGEPGRALFHTREISVWSGDTLVAFSWFDLGETSVQSLIGVYEPAQRKHGLGFWTLLLEIAHAAEIGMRFHYAGYVLGEPSGMDYKRAVGPLEYLDPVTRRWQGDLPYPALQSPAEILRTRLAEAADALARSGTSADTFLNSALQIQGIDEQVPGCAPFPILLICASTEHPWGLLIAWEQDAESYTIFSGRPIAIALEAPDGTTAPLEVHLFIVQERLGDHASAEEVAFWARYYLPLLTPGPAE